MNSFASNRDRARHRCALPPERRAGLPFIYEPDAACLMAPWPRRRGDLPADDLARLDATIARLAALDPAPRAPV